MPSDLDKFFNSKTGHSLIENMRHTRIQVTRIAEALEHQNILASKLLGLFKEAVEETVTNTADKPVPDVETL